MASDAAAYGHRFPAYREDPIAETPRAIRGLDDPYYARIYDRFQKAMVYGEPVDYATSMKSLRELASVLEKTL